MSNESSNALSELSEKMAMYADFHKEEDKANNGLLTKVSKIMAELAKVTADYTCDPWREFDLQSKQAVIFSRKIANGERLPTFGGEV